MRLKGKILAISLVFALIFSALPILVSASQAVDWYITPPTQKTYAIGDPSSFSFSGLTITVYDDQKNSVTLSYEDFGQPAFGEYVALLYDPADFSNSSVYVTVTYGAFKPQGFTLRGIAPEDAIDSFTVEILHPQREGTFSGYYYTYNLLNDLIFTLNYTNRAAETFTYDELYAATGFEPIVTPYALYGSGTHDVTVELIDKTSSFQVEILEYDLLAELTNASVITAGSTAAATISTPGGYAYFKFTPAVSGTYVFYSTGYNDTFGYLYDAYGQEIAYDDDMGSDSNFSISYDLEAGTQYYYGVCFYGGYLTGDISVTLELSETFFEKLQNAPALVLNETATAIISEPKGYAYFKFTPSVSGPYTFSASANDLVNVSLYNSEGVKIIDGADGSWSNLQRYLKAGTQYYCSVRFNTSWWTGSISVTLNRYTSSFLETLENESTKLTLNEIETAYIPTIGASAYFKFTPAESGYYTFRHGSDRYTAGWGDTSYASTFGALYDSFGQSLTYDSNYYRGTGYNFSITYYLEAGIPYYCQTRFNSSGVYGSYPVLMEKFIDTLNNPHYSKKIYVNSTIHERMYDPGSFSYFSFTPSVSGEYDFYFSSNDTAFGRLFDEDGAPIEFVETSGHNLALISHYLEAGKCYYYSVVFYTNTDPDIISIFFESDAVASNFDPGDANRDGEVNANDLVFIKEQLLFGNRMTDRQKALADHDGSGAVDIIDLVRIKKAMAG